MRYGRLSGTVPRVVPRPFLPWRICFNSNPSAPGGPAPVQRLEDPANLENLRIVLVRTRNPLNIGAAARAMSNFGAFHLRVVKPYEKAFREAVSAVGAARLLAKARAHDSVAEATSDCTLVIGTTAIGHRELQHELYSLEEAAKKIRKAIGS